MKKIRAFADGPGFKGSNELRQEADFCWALWNLNDLINYVPFSSKRKLMWKIAMGIIAGKKNPQKITQEKHSRKKVGYLLCPCLPLMYPFGPRRLMTENCHENNCRKKVPKNITQEKISRKNKSVIHYALFCLLCALLSQKDWWEKNCHGNNCRKKVRIKNYTGKISRKNKSREKCQWKKFPWKYWKITRTLKM